VSTTRYRLEDPPFADRAGRGVTVAVVDSGIVPGHPHVGAVERGEYFGHQETNRVSFIDRIGHGTAVAAAIREKAPAAELIAVRIFDVELATSAAVLARAILWSAERGARLANLSLGTPNPARASVLRDAVERAVSLGTIVVSPREIAGDPAFPGSLPGVVGVRPGAGIARDELVVDVDDSGGTAWRASELPRPIPGVPPQRNVWGISFAVANVTGFLARLLEDHPQLTTADAVRDHLARSR
jgi:subtilisin family serine protease